MSESGLALLVLGLPLAATLLTPLLFGGRLARYAHLPAVLGFAAAAVASLVLLVWVVNDPYPQPTPTTAASATSPNPAPRLSLKATNASPS